MQDRAKKRRFVLYIIVLAAIGGMLYGYDIGIIAGALLFIHNTIAMTDNETSFLVAAVLGGGALATLVTGVLADWFGRRNTFVAAALIFISGVLGVSFAETYPELLIGRLTQGIGVGIITIAIPLYLSESLPSHVRGRGTSAFQLFLTAGILLASLISLYFVPSGNWRGMFLSATLPAIVLFVGGLFLPTSPRWLFMKGRYDQALAVLRLSRSDEEAETEFNEMRSVLIEQQSDIKHTLWQKRYMLPLLIAFAVAILNQLTGINSLLQFSAVILKNSGLSSDLVAVTGSSAITGLNFLVTIVALSLIDKLGRKFLLCVGTAGVTLAMVYCGAVFAFMAPGALKGYMLLGGTLGFILFFAIGPGVVVWLALSELLPSRIRSKGMAVGLFLNSLASTLLAAVFMDLVRHLGYAGTFWLCGFFTLLYFLVAFFLMPETKDQTLEQIEAKFAR